MSADDDASFFRSHSQVSEDGRSSGMMRIRGCFTPYDLRILRKQKRRLSFRLTRSSLLRCYSWETPSVLSRLETGFDCESSLSHTLTAYDFVQRACFFLDDHGSRSFLSPQRERRR